jgi:hypothetical protein
VYWTDEAGEHSGTFLGMRSKDLAIVACDDWTIIIPFALLD